MSDETHLQVFDMASEMNSNSSVIVLEEVQG